MENKTENLSALEELMIQLGSRRFDVVTHPHIKPFVRTAKLKEIDKLIDRLKPLLEKDKEQRKELIIKIRSEAMYNNMCALSNPVCKEDLENIKEIAQNEAEQYYKQKHESNE